MVKILVILMYGLIIVSAAAAGEMKQYNYTQGTQGRSYHSDVYNDNCNGCHTNSNGKLDATDAACIGCHGAINMIKIDEKKLVFPKANPHKSVHYGNGASCLACHSEHQMKAPVCASCHRTWFKSM